MTRSAALFSALVVLLVAVAAPAEAMPCAICKEGCPSLSCPYGIGLRPNPCDCCPPCAKPAGAACKSIFECAAGLVCLPSSDKRKKHKFCQQPPRVRHGRSLPGEV